MVRSLSLSAQNGSRWINGTDAGTFAWAQNCFYFLFFYNKIQSKIPYVLMTTQWIGHCFKKNVFIWKNWALSRGNWVFFLKTFGYLPFQSISDVTNIMLGIPFACQSSELLPTVRKPRVPTLPHAKRCSIQVPPQTFTFFFCSWKPSVFQGPVDPTGSQSCWRFCKKVIVKCFKRFDNIIKCFLSGSSTVCNFLRISLLSGRIERKLIKPYFPRQTINLPLIGIW